MRANRRIGIKLVERPAWVEASLWRRLRFEAEIECREALFNRYVPLARAAAARNFEGRGSARGEFRDYQQLAYEGLLQAIDRFDPRIGVPFPAYAQRRIVGNIANGIPRMSEVRAQLNHRRRVEQERLRSLAHELPAKEQQPVSRLTDLAVGLAIGLMLEEAPLFVGNDSVDPAPSAYDRLEFRQMQMRLTEAVSGLPEKEAIVVRQHYGNDLSFAQIADLVGLSRGRISQLHQAAIDRLRKKIGTNR